jgi:hypothetical protein
MAYGEDVRGVGGWLAFFLVTLGIISPAVTIFYTVTSFGDPEAAYLPPDLFRTLSTIDIASTVVVVALCLFAAWRLLRVFNWNSVRIAVATLWLIALTNVLVIPLLVSGAVGLPLSMVFEAGGPQTIFRPLGYATIWTAYLLISKRVRNTYGRQSDGETAEVFA